MFSQNLVPVHIAFIPILIPPLLTVFNKLKIDRRALACALTFGLKAPYISLPLGFGLIFHQILVDNITQAGLPISVSDTKRVMWIGGLSMLVGLIFCVLVLYRKEREYQDLPIVGAEEDTGEAVMSREAWGALAGCIVTAAISAITESLPLGALGGLIVMLLTGCIKIKNLDDVINGGIGMMGFIAFVMLVASGYANVLRTSGAVEELVDAATSIYVRFKSSSGFHNVTCRFVNNNGYRYIIRNYSNCNSNICPIGTSNRTFNTIYYSFNRYSSGLGDAGSPASDSTLGPTSGLNADGQHNHIWDTCVPTFITYDIFLIIGGVVATMIFG